jgi:hypothetical protein
MKVGLVIDPFKVRLASFMQSILSLKNSPEKSTACLSLRERALRHDVLFKANGGVQRGPPSESG